MDAFSFCMSGEKCLFLAFIFVWMHLCIWLSPCWLQRVGSLMLAASRRIWGSVAAVCELVSCSTRDLIPWPGTAQTILHSSPWGNMWRQAVPHRSAPLEGFYFNAINFYSLQSFFFYSQYPLFSVIHLSDLKTAESNCEKSACWLCWEWILRRRLFLSL